MATAIFLVEKECGLDIRYDYPLKKFFSLFDELSEFYKKQKEELDKVKK